MTSSDIDPEAIGWQAIDSQLERIYGSAEPLHWAPPLHFALGGGDPLDGISAYPRLDPIPHWHFVTYGLSELYAKENDDPAVSGFGFELTFRLSRKAADTAPPSWVFSFLQNLARYVFSTGNAFQSGHYMDLNGPVALGVDTAIRAIVLAADPELPAIETPNGSLAFLEVVGITLDELECMRAWRAQRVLGLFAALDPLHITDIQRTSRLANESLHAAIKAGTLAEGSSTAALFISLVSLTFDTPDTLTITLGATGVRELRAILPGRLPFGRDLTVAGNDATIHITAGSQCSYRFTTPTDAEVVLTDEATSALMAVLQPFEGVYQIPAFPAVRFHVRKSLIKDRSGNVVEVIG